MRRTRVLGSVLSLATAVALAVVPTAHAGNAGHASRSGVPAERVGAARAVTLHLVGNGFGHGHGLSQWGAQKQALAGRSRGQVLRFYYPDLDTGTASGRVRVLLTGDTTDDVVVVARPGLRARSLATGRTLTLDQPGARRWRVQAAAGGSRSTIAFRDSTGWHAVRTVPGEVDLSAGGRPVTLVTPGGRHRYRGALRSARPSSSSAQRETVNVLPLEAYLRGVVPREVYTSWEPVALQAQAVAARTYAAFERDDHAERWFHVDDTTSSQVYGGADDEVASTDAAIAATARQVLTSGGRPAFTQFSASNGGWMAAGSQPYLVAKQDPYDDTYRGWTDAVTADEIERAFPALGTFRSASVLERDGNGQWDGRVLRIRLVGSRAATTISGDTFRSSFGLRSTWFDLP